jgi:hypothetical protein
MRTDIECRVRDGNKEGKSDYQHDDETQHYIPLSHVRAE